MKSRLYKRGISTGYDSIITYGKTPVKAKFRIEFKLNLGMVRWGGVLTCSLKYTISLLRSVLRT